MKRVTVFTSQKSLLTYALETKKKNRQTKLFLKTNKDGSLLRLSPGQFRVLHARSCRDAPAQVLPPLLGDGFVQLRLRSCSPVPQLLLQVFHELQVDQPPSTEQKEREK